MVDGHIVQIILQAALDGVAAGLLDLAAPALDVVEGDAQCLADLLSGLLAEAAVLLDDHLDGVLVGDDLFEGLVAGSIDELLGKHDVDEVLAQTACQTGNLGATAELILGGALLITPLSGAGIGHDQIALFACIDDHGCTHTAGRGSGDIDGGACGQLRKHDALQGSSVVVSSGADFLSGEGQLNGARQLHAAGSSCNTPSCGSSSRSSRGSSGLSAGSHAGAACQSGSSTNDTSNLHEISARDLHNVFSFSLGVSLSGPDCVFQPSSAALPLFTVFVRLCCLNYIQFGQLSQARSSARQFHFATQINFLPKSVPEIVPFWNNFRNLTRIIVSR